MAALSLPHSSGAAVWRASAHVTEAAPMFDPTYLDQLLAQATLAAAAARAVETVAAVLLRPSMRVSSAHSVMPSSWALAAPVTALTYNLAINGDHVLLFAGAIQAVALATVLAHAHACRPERAGTAKATDCRHD